MEEYDPQTTPKGLADLNSWLETFCDTQHIPNITFDKSYEDSAYMEYEDIMNLTSEECYAHAFTVMNYVGYLQKKLDLSRAMHNWCINALDFLYSKVWNNYDKWLPAEIRKKSIIAENSFADVVQKNEIRLSSTIFMLEEGIKDLRKKVSLLQDLGKKRSFT
jgi:hypothetical protein